MGCIAEWIFLCLNAYCMLVDQLLLRFALLCICCLISLQASMITLVAQIHRTSEASSTLAKIRSDLHRHEIDRSTFLEELKNKLALKATESISSVEYYDAVATRFVGIADDAKFVEFQQYCKGPTKIVINIIDESRIEADNAPKLLKGRMLNIVEDGLPIANSILKISSPGEAELGTGLTIWDGSIVLAKYLEANPTIVVNKAVLEVGSGTGIVGIVAGLMGANRSVLTDLQYTLKNLQLNIDKNKPHSEESYNVEVMELDWFNAATYPTTHDDNGSEKNWDVVLGADVVWIEELILPLVNTLVAIAGFQTDVYIAHQTRSKFSDDIFFTNMEKYFTVNRQSFEVPEGFTSGASISIYHFRKRAV